MIRLPWSCIIAAIRGIVRKPWWQPGRKVIISEIRSICWMRFENVRTIRWLWETWIRSSCLKMVLPMLWKVPPVSYWSGLRSFPISLYLRDAIRLRRFRWPISKRFTVRWTSLMLHVNGGVLTVFFALIRSIFFKGGNPVCGIPKRKCLRFV